eukprot:TRINITY_DN5711_c0_g1_i2.p1 TRINITY_DN5711_c0_g1~~TRINITY_DN5711_c0_g1_i2.p1  ORF type:complete len:1037 (+),score=167.93 TRINITY_DN5711_c0_g1_i2:119-3229(+)
MEANANSHPRVTYYPVGLAPNNGISPTNTLSNGQSPNPSASKGIGCCRAVVLGVFAFLIFLFVVIYANVSRPFYTADLDNIEKMSGSVKSGRFSNGLSYFILKNPIKRQRATLYLRIQAGSMDEDEQQLGIAHFIEHMAFDSTSDFPTRGGTWDHLMQLGAQFNAFTSFRTTVFELWDVPVDSIEAGLSAHLTQTLHMKLVQSNLDQEKGAVLGEARFRNGSDSVVITDMLTNHFGPKHRVISRFPIGDPAAMHYSVENAQRFIDKWYRVDRMNVYVVGDVDVQKTEEAIKKVWGSQGLGPNQPARAPDHPTINSAEPQKSLLTKNVDGIDGISAYFLLTSPYESFPHTDNYYRQMFLDTIFSFFYTIQVASRYSSMYPELPIEELLSKRLAGVAVEDEFSFNTKLHLMAVMISGDSQAGTWQGDMEVAFSELRRIAYMGPNKEMLLALMYELQFMLYEQERYSRYDSTMLANSLLGGLDPSFVYLDPVQQREMCEKYLSFGFLESAAIHVQAEAQFMWNSLVKTILPSETKPFASVDSVAGTFSVFTGKSKSDHLTISESSIKAVFSQVYKAQHPLSDFPAASFSMGSSSDQGLPESGLLLDLKKATQGMTRPPVLVQDDGPSGVRRYTLANGIAVNVKVSRSGKNRLPNGPKGLLHLELVALGGLASESPDISTACHFVNSASPSGNRVYYSSTDYTEYDSSTVQQYLATHPGNARVVCDEEYMIVGSTLFGMCPNYPEEETCYTSADNYMNSLIAARLAMFPRYNERSIKSASDSLEEMESQYHRTEDPLDVLSYDARNQLFRKMFPDDPRLHEPTSSGLAKLDPLAVSQWVAQHFSSPNRIEINIAGDCSGESNLLSQLNTVFGSMQLLTFAKPVGFNPYSSEDVPHFQRRFPEHSYSHNCSVSSVSPDRAFALLLGPAPGYLHLREREEHIVGKPLLSMQAFKIMRQDNGYGYFAMTSTKHSILFPEWGYYEMNWAPGPYGCPSGVCKTSPAGDKLHLNSSSVTAIETFQRSFTQQLFTSVTVQFLSFKVP